MMTLSLIVAVCIATVLVLSGLALLYLRFRQMEDRLQHMDREMRQFYRDLGRPKAEIINIRGRNRPS